MFKVKTNPTEVQSQPTDDSDGSDDRANLDYAYSRIHDLSEQNQGLGLEVRQLVEDLALVAREYDDLSTRVLPHLTTPKWPQVEPVRAVICDELAADTEGFEGFWDDAGDADDAGTRYLAGEQLPPRQAVSP